MLLQPGICDPPGLPSVMAQPWESTDRPPNARFIYCASAYFLVNSTELYWHDQYPTTSFFYCSFLVNSTLTHLTQKTTYNLIHSPIYCSSTNLLVTAFSTSHIS